MRQEVAKAHKIEGKAKYNDEHDIWVIPLLCELNGEMAVIDVAFGDEQSINELHKYFSKPTIEPLELVV